MSLIEVCEPVFVYVCALMRAGAGGAAPRPEAIRSEIKGVFAGMHSSAVSDAELENQYEMVELPLLFFVDFMILESRFEFARGWEPLAYERNELAGDQKFFDMLEETLGDVSDEADERLAVFHTCLGLGFNGMYEPGSDYLIRVKRRVYARVRKAAGVRSSERMCPEAYEHVDTSNFIQQTGRKLGAMALALLGLIGVLLAVNFFLFRYSSQAMGVVLDRIVLNSGAKVPQSKPVRRVPPGGGR